MSYQEYITLAMNRIKNLKPRQKAAVILVIILVLAVGVFFLNPKKRLLERRNSQRRSDVVNILNAVYKYTVDGGVLPSIIGTEPIMICSGNTSSCEGLVDLSPIIEKEKLVLSEIPIDPKEERVNISGYQISKLASGRINVTAPLAENNAVISLSK